MKKNVTIILIIINIIFIFAIISKTIDANNKDDEIKTLTSKIESLNGKVSQYDTNNKTETLLNDEKVKINIVSFIDAHFNYTNKNYKSRTEDIKKYVTTDIYNALKGAGDITTPKTNIQNKVDNLNIYLTTNNNKKVSALVNIKTIYTVEGKACSPINQIIELDLQELEKDKWIITKYTLMGNFQPNSTNK